MYFHVGLPPCGIVMLQQLFLTGSITNTSGALYDDSHGLAQSNFPSEG